MVSIPFYFLRLLQSLTEMKKCEFVNDQWWASQLNVSSVLKTLTFWFPETPWVWIINIMNAKLCMMALLTDSVTCMFMPLSVTWPYFSISDSQECQTVSVFSWDFMVFIWFVWNLAWLLVTTSSLWLPLVFKGDD